MNKEEYLAEKKSLEERFNEEKKSLDIRYARESCPVKIGDVVTDHYKTIQVEKFILYYDYHSMPCMSFIGLRLTKAGKPAKRDKYDNKVFLQNVTQINGKPYKYKE